MKLYIVVNNACEPVKCGTKPTEIYTPAYLSIEAANDWIEQLKATDFYEMNYTVKEVELEEVLIMRR